MATLAVAAVAVIHTGKFILTETFSLSSLSISSNARFSGKILEPAVVCDGVGPRDSESTLVSQPIPKETPHIAGRRIHANFDILAPAEVTAATLTVAPEVVATAAAVVVVTAVAVEVVTAAAAVVATAVEVVVVTAAVLLVVTA